MRQRLAVWPTHPRATHWLDRLRLCLYASPPVVLPPILERTHRRRRDELTAPAAADIYALPREPLAEWIGAWLPRQRCGLTTRLGADSLTTSWPPPAGSTLLDLDAAAPRCRSDPQATSPRTLGMDRTDGPQTAVLTNMHNVSDYDTLAAETPDSYRNPALTGMT